MTATIGARATTHQERRASTAERLSVITGVLERLDVDLAADPGGVLRAAVRTLVPLAVQVTDFDLTISTGPNPDVAVRLYRDGTELRTDVITPSGSAAPASPVVSELAELLRRGQVRPR